MLLLFCLLCIFDLITSNGWFNIVEKLPAKKPIPKVFIDDISLLESINLSFKTLYNQNLHPTDVDCFIIVGIVPI